MDIKAIVLIAGCVIGGLTMMGSRCASPPSPDGSVKKDILKGLTPAEERVILDGGTERAFTGKFHDHKDAGTYICRRCNLPLYHSDSKFDSGCGWPSFDDEIPSAVRRLPDADGTRTEIRCSYCDAHLGHVFQGEGFTPKNLRHCVNSISMDFVPAERNLPRNRAFFAGGCFWGVEALLEEQAGVLDVRSGYMGGNKPNPTYRQVSSGSTGHAETVEVIYDPSQISYEKLTQLFFEIHDFTQLDRQGPDIGSQYRSEVFYTLPEQKETATRIIRILKDRGFDVKTRLSRADFFWPAEDYHQDYYARSGGQPYCHRRRKIF